MHANTPTRRFQLCALGCNGAFSKGSTGLRIIGLALNCSVIMASYNGLLAAAAPSSPVRPMPSLVDALKSAGTAGESPVKLHGLTSVAVATRDSADLSQGVAAMSLTTVAEGLSGQKVVDSREAVGSTAAAASTLHTGGVSKRADYLHWDDYFMAVAFLSAMRSKGW